MPTQMNLEELKTLIANEIRSKGLDGALPADAIEKIKNKIISQKKRESAQNIPSVVSELDIPSFPDQDERMFPDQSQVEPSPAQPEEAQGDNEFHVDAGAVASEQPSIPTMGYTPELPEMLQKAEPGEVIVFDYSDVSQGGENLSFKPMRLMSDPDVKKSMHDLWMEEGKTKADVYVAKFEKIGQVEFNYADGTSKFVEKTSMPDYQGTPGYKENPYAEDSIPQIDEPAKQGLETYIKSSVDLERVVHDMVKDILRDALLTNTEKAVNDNPMALGAVDPNNPNIPTDEQGRYIQEDIYKSEDNPGFGVDTTQMVKPMEESVDHGDEEIEFKITMAEIVENEDYQKIVLPNELNESINSGDKSMLVNENEVVQEWRFEGKRYFTPVGRISKDKGYIKR